MLRTDVDVLNIDVVVKLGGGVLAHADRFSAALTVIGTVATTRRILIVPGGGPFADAVREVERRIHLSDDAAHWMAVLGMDQYAHLIAARLRDASTIDDPSQIAATLDERRVPVLAPYRWMRAADPLPHSWDVTSDSIAAWVAGAVGARSVVLVKPAAVRSGLDPYFDRALPGHVKAVVVAADQLDRFDAVLRGSIEE